ncbi:hypothetical protein OAQ99_00645 [Candidatus Kapabacteria bacterium]|nr:hypothetical protein [Candidatus Kapabacteria bacterium]
MRTLLLILALGFLSFSCDDDNQPVVNYSYDIDAQNIFFSVNNTSWNYDNSTGSWFYTFNTDIIDKFAVDFGVVLVYMADLNSNSDRWRSIPRTEIYYHTDTTGGVNIGDFNYSIEYGYWFGPGYLELEMYHSNPTEFFPDFDADFKLLVLSELEAKTLKENGINTSNYNDVKNALNLK